MAHDTTIRKSDQDALHFVRWVLLLIVAAEAAGVGRLSRHRLHALLFLSFASSSYYQIKPLRQRAQRTEHGPYYRAAHLALGNLALGGLIDIGDFAAHPSPKDLQFEATFALTREGLKVANILRGTMTGESLFTFLLDMCLASMSAMRGTPDDAQTGVAPEAIVDEIDGFDRMLEHDLSYSEAVSRNESILRITETVDDQPTTVLGLKSINGYLSKTRTVNQRDVFTTYQRLIKRRAA